VTDLAVVFVAFDGLQPTDIVGPHEVFAKEHEVLLTVGRDGAERVLIDPAAIDPAAIDPAAIDPAAIDPAGSTTLDAWWPSREGALLGLPAVRAN
jgi:hypothetical protein